MPEKTLSKTCSQCKQSLPLDRFSNRSRSKDGKMAACKSCRSKSNKEYRQHRGGREKNTQWIRDNADRLNERRRSAYARDPDKKQDANRLWREQNPDKVRSANRRNRLKHYGLTVEDYDRMLKSYSGVCPICRQAPDWGGRPAALVVDHCHIVGKVRGLLCWRCNGALGLLGESNLARAVEYLARFENTQSGGWPN